MISSALIPSLVRHENFATASFLISTALSFLIAAVIGSTSIAQAYP
jgi:hypothetical protein